MAIPFLLLLWLPPTEDETFVETLVRRYLDKQPLALAFVGEFSQARAAQIQFVKRLEPSLGPVIGYKAALTNEASQKRFGVKEPILGHILSQMVLKSPATIPRSFATRGLFEADLVVRVSDPKINHAQSEREVLESIDAIYPFLELPDMVYHTDVPLNGPGLTAINAGARLGILGPEVKIQAGRDWFAVLENIQVRVWESPGRVRAMGNSNSLMGHPLRVVLWIKDALNQQNLRLKAGDLLSLGSITRPLPVAKTAYLRLEYVGLIPQKTLGVQATFSD